MTILAIGIDAGFSNMGLVRVSILPRPGWACDVTCLDLQLVSTSVTEDRKMVRKSSTELRRARELHEELVAFAAGAQFAFAEVPSGSQSAAAARALGIAVGILAACPIPIIEVSPMEVKQAVTGGKQGHKIPTKAEMITWALKGWPAAPWILHGRSGKNFKKGDVQNCNEHLADALATVAAGVKTPEFQRLLSLSETWGGPTASPRRVRLV